MFTNYADVSSLVVGLGLPAVVALFSRPSTNSTVKAVAHAVLAVATGFWAVYQAYPQHFYWAPAVVAAFLAWLSGTTAYHSLLKKYSWFTWLQNALVAETASRLHTEPVVLVKEIETAKDAQPTAPEPAPASLSPESVQQIVTALEEVLRKAVPAAVADVAEVPAPAAVAARVVHGLGPRRV